ncbi:putative signal peptidase [Plesiocystis pacifica SIR-1]|uniref:Signal peptidase I n=1 Tax=Plesiocystis pacifica SIR-1 TaxID=391625 RepID=A6G4Z3_9BACT|nr:signal peptidase I [Plesiocystis pacifica]EDM79085.1 putative signal peptidase [Plesiocystis pacifica SIR-1]
MNESGEPEANMKGSAARANRKRDVDETAEADPAASRSAPVRSAGHVRSGARMLIKEANKILRKHRERIPEKVVEEIEATVTAIEALREQKPNEDLVELEYKAEHLDELLHQHASFARKSALRDSLENIVIAIGVALAVRSAVYEPFQIPSGSMMPTLRAGDHIFVNKFRYGVQVPLTTTIVGEDLLAGVARGEVIVFRYPLDESQDFIKRVIGLPGDTIRVNTDRRRIELKRAGEEEFAAIERERLDDVRCLEEGSTEPMDNCSVFRETLDGRSYQVRYRDDQRSMDASTRTFVVPEGHLLVMGDNRNASHDSVAWTVVADSVTAKGLISRIDIRDLAKDHQEGRIELRDEDKFIVANDDANQDQARYVAERPSEAHGLALEAWRAPPVDPAATFASLAHHYGANERVELSALIENARLTDRERERLEALSEELGEFRFGKNGAVYEAVFRPPGVEDAMFRLHCGVKRCERRSEVADRIARIVEAYEANPDYDSRELLVREPGRPTTFPGRGKADERYLERRFGTGGKVGKGVRLRAWRKPHEGVEVLRDAVLAEFGAGPVAEAMGLESEPPVQARAVSGVGAEGPEAQTWSIPAPSGGWTLVHADADRGVLFALECGTIRCGEEAQAVELATTIAGRVQTVLTEAERLPELLTRADVGGLPEVPVPGKHASESGAEVGHPYYWDHLAFRGAVLADSHSIALSVLRRPEQGLEAAAQEFVSTLGSNSDEAPEPVDGLGPSAWYAHGPNGHGYVFVIAETELVVSLRCRTGLCPDRDTARKFAERAYDKGLDTDNFLQKGVSKPRPFVPRGNVKGRAEVIWWPTSRFWTPID